jgi:hypothetical protein
MRNRNNTKENGMIQIQNATVETLDNTQARPVGSTVLSVTIGDHTFTLLVDENELAEAMASANGGTKPCLTPAP